MPARSHRWQDCMWIEHPTSRAYQMMDFFSCCYGRLPALWQTDVTNHGFIFIQQKQKPSWVAEFGSDWSHVLQKAQFVPEEQRSEFLYFVLSLLRFFFSFFLGFYGLTKKLVSEHKILKVCTFWSDYLGFFLGFFGLTKNVVSEA